MDKKIFREYDIRGVVGTQLFIEKTPALARAILTYFLQQKPNLKKIIVGMDGRTHSPEIKNHIIETANKMGIDVVDIGICPTPVFYFTLFNTEITSGMIVTASHNPSDYNGIKICLEKRSVWGSQIQEIKTIYDKTKDYSFEKPFDTTPAASLRANGNKTKTKCYDAISPYIAWLKSHFSHLQNLDIDAVIDCGNGTAGAVLPKLIETMGWKNVKLLFQEIDGNFPNHEPDPTTKKNMVFVKEVLEKESYKVGIGLDGDCDRMNPMTKSGYLVPGDQMVAIYAKKVIESFPGASIVFDIKSSQALVQALESYGAVPCISPSGHSIVKDNLRKHNAKLAGEISCHFFFNDRYFGYDDGIYAALRLFEQLEESNKSLGEMVKALPQKVTSPEYRIECEEEDKETIVSHVTSFFAARKDATLLTIDGVRAEMPYGWGLIRASNTQSVLCLRFESDDNEGLKKTEEDFISALEPFFTKKELLERFGE